MARAQLDPVVRHIRGLVASQAAREQCDRELLQAFSLRNDEAAFAALVRRHGPMVLGVCRQVLGHEQDAEDAFQATFLVLARKAGSIRKGEALASWLHGVAHYTAMKAKRGAAKRRVHEARAKPTTPRDPSAEAACRELQVALNEEIQRLPARYRDPFVLCFLEGQSRSQAARELGLAEGTVWSRLARARRRLQEQLARRGVALSAVLCAVGLGRATAAVPAMLVKCTTKAASCFAASKAVAAELVSAEVTGLAKGVIQTMFMTKLRMALLFLSAVVAAGGAGLLTHGALADTQAATGLKKTPPAQAREEAKPREDPEQFAAIVLSNTRPVGADDRPNQDVTLAKGTRAHAFKLAKDEKLAESIRPGVMVDVIGEISEPIETAVPLENVKLLAIDMDALGNATLTVQVTRTQEKVLVLLQEVIDREGILRADCGPDQLEAEITKLLKPPAAKSPDEPNR